MNPTVAWTLADEAATVVMGRRLAASLSGEGLVAHLVGDLGAGKTTLARAWLQALGVGERVKSPTYSLVESYILPERTAWHLDLYRIADPTELEWLGLDALAEPSALVLVEWPEHGQEGLPPADLRLELVHAGNGRELRLLPASPRGERLLVRLEQGREG